MRIKSRRTTTYVETYSLSFTHNGSGFGFECDKDGNVDTSKLNPCALESYNQCLTGYITRKEGVQYDIDRQASQVSDTNPYGETVYVPIPGTGTLHTYKVSPEIQTYGKHIHTPAVGECNRCGADVHLYGFTNTCECGADYNMSGQELAPREQWGEETGESLADILAADTDTDMEECPPTVRSERSPIIAQSRPIHVEVL